jgi:hypothetical protein
MMKDNRVQKVWAAIAIRACTDGSTISPQDACAACVEALGITGATLTLSTSSVLAEPVCVTDEQVGEVEEFQGTVCEGPGIDAVELGIPVIVDDLSTASATRRWPNFAPRALQLGIHAVCSLPLALGAVRLGSLNLYNDAPLKLGNSQLLDALVYADIALLLVLDVRGGIETPLSSGVLVGEGATLRNAEVHQAAGMVSVQLGFSVVDSLVLLRAHSYSNNQRLSDVARAVVERRLSFSISDDGKTGPRYEREGQQ